MYITIKKIKHHGACARYPSLCAIWPQPVATISRGNDSYTMTSPIVSTSAGIFITLYRKPENAVISNAISIALMHRPSTPVPVAAATLAPSIAAAYTTAPEEKSHISMVICIDIAIAISIGTTIVRKTVTIIDPLPNLPAVAMVKIT